MKKKKEMVHLTLSHLSSELKFEEWLKSNFEIFQDLNSVNSRKRPIKVKKKPVKITNSVKLTILKYIKDNLYGKKLSNIEEYKEALDKIITSVSYDKKEEKK
jgi:hypothetical protein